MREPNPLSGSKHRQPPLFPRIINLRTAATLLAAGYSLCPIVLFANAQSTSTSGSSGSSSVYVYVNDTTQWSTQGNWTIQTASRGFQSNWLVGARPEGSTTPTTISLAFNGVAIVVFGTVVDGIQNQSMNLTVKLDDDASLEPTYAPVSPSNGMDINYQLFNKGPLDGSSVHTLVIEITGETSPFWLQGVVYNPVNPGSATVSSAASTMSQTTSSSDSTGMETAKLGGAIGGGIGALILVALIIFFMMRRIRRLENRERKLQATPFFLRDGPLPGSTPHLGTGSRVNLAASGARNDPSGGKGQNSAFSSKQDLRQGTGASASAQSWNNYEKRGNTSNKDLTSSSVRKGDSERRSNSISRNPDPYASSSRSRSQSQSYTSPASRHTSNLNSASPPVHNSVYNSSPSASHISLPSEYQATTVGNGLGTAVASSYIGTSPLPDVWDPDAPPVPALPANVSAKSGADHNKDGKRKSSKSAKSSKSRKQSSHSAHPTSPPYTDPLSAGLGLFSPNKDKADAENPNNSTASLSRPLPIVPGTRSSAPKYSFPPEKVGLSPPPPKRRGSKDSIRKKPLPLGDNERERRDVADKTDTPTTMHTNTVTTPSYTTHNTNTTGSYYSSPPPPHTPPTR